jgi:hypothetical protein
LNLDFVANEIDDIRYCIIDASIKEPDVFFVPLTFLEIFFSPSLVLTIGPYRLNMPLDWSILACDEEFNDIEIIPLKSLNDRGFHAVVHNPLSDVTPNSYEINIVNAYADVKWYFPKLKTATILAVPLEEGIKPKCAYFVKETNKLNQVNLSDLF